ncbi:MAG: hypothetical protein ACKPKO_42535, partial [Candidatus Fonsibacter sp.]
GGTKEVMPEPGGSGGGGLAKTKKRARSRGNAQVRLLWVLEPCNRRRRAVYKTCLRGAKVTAVESFPARRGRYNRKPDNQEE